MIKRRILLAELTPGIPQPQIFATWNPADKHADVALSGGDLIATKSTTHAANWACVRANQSVSAGQAYWETTYNYTGTGDVQSGIASSSWVLADAPGAASSISSLWRAAGIGKDGDVKEQGVTIASIGAIANGGIVRHWLDMDSGTYRVANGGGAWVQVQATGWWLRTAQYPITGLLRPSGATASCTANFGQSPFAYAPPDGANAGIFTAPSTPTTLYLGSEGFDAEIDSSPVHFMGRIAGDQDVEIEREGSCWVWGGNAISRRGQLVVVNNDGALDAWRDYLWRDATVLLRAGWEGDDYGDFVPLAFARVDTIELTRDARIVLSFSDPVAWLDRQLQPTLYPADQANLQLAGKPLPIVYGAPLYCTPAQLSTVPAERDYQLHDDTGATALIAIDQVYDAGDVFNGPDDAFTPHDAVTAANGGNFGSWSGPPTRSVPAGWSIPGTAEFAIGVDGFFNGGTSGGVQFLQCVSIHAAIVQMMHSETLHARTLYRITFNCTGITTPGALIFRAGGGPDAVASLTSTGPKSIALYVRDAAKLRMVMQGDGINVYIKELRVSAEQVIDWTYWGTTRGFTLANSPYGKVVANPRNGVDDLNLIAQDVATRTGIPDVTIDGTTYDAIDSDSIVMADPSLPSTKLAGYFDAPITGLAVLKAALDSFCGFITSNRLGQVAFGRIKQPSASLEVLTLDESNILGEIIVTTDVAKDLSIRLAGGKNNTVHDATDIVSGVPVDLATELQTEYRYTVEGAAASSEPVSSAYAAAIAAPAQRTMMQSQSALQAEANRVATLWRTTRNFYQLTAILDPAVAESEFLEPGQTVRLVWPRWGLDSGKNLLVIGIRTRFFSRRVQLKLWG